MNRFVLFASLALALPAASVLGQENAPGLVVPMHAFVELDRKARDRFATNSAQDRSPAAVIDSIRAEEDPVAREVMWNAWLDSLNPAAPLEPAQILTLQSLDDHSPVLGIPHHEFPNRTVPAYQIADRAKVLLARDAARRRAVDLAHSPQDLQSALNAPLDSREFSDGLLALEQITPQALSKVIAEYRRAISSRPAAARVLLKAAQINPAFMNLLPQIVTHGDPETARLAIRSGLDRSVAFMPEIAAEALARPELGGLALRAAEQAGMDADSYCWDLLDDASLGADAARLLAADSINLIEQIRRRIDSASSRARIRMLLALKLRNSHEARELLTELVEATWLSEQQRREVRSWL